MWKLHQFLVPVLFSYCGCIIFSSSHFRRDGFFSWPWNRNWTRCHRNHHRTVGWNCVKLTHSFHKQKPLPWAPEWARERSGTRERSEKCGASNWVSGASKQANRGANGPILYASILWSFYPLCDGCSFCQQVSDASSLLKFPKLFPHYCDPRHFLSMAIGL